MAFNLALKTIAANDDVLVGFEVATIAELREQLFERAPSFDFHIYFHHSPVNEYFCLYDGEKKQHMGFRRSDFSASDIKRAWSGIMMMAAIESKAKRKIAGRAMTAEMAARYPKVSAEVIIIHA